MDSESNPLGPGELLDRFIDTFQGSVFPKPFQELLNAVAPDYPTELAEDQEIVEHIEVTLAAMRSDQRIAFWLTHEASIVQSLLVLTAFARLREALVMNLDQSTPAELQARIKFLLLRPNALRACRMGLRILRGIDPLYDDEQP